MLTVINLLKKIILFYLLVMFPFGLLVGVFYYMNVDKKLKELSERARIESTKLLEGRE